MFKQGRKTNTVRRWSAIVPIALSSVLLSACSGAGNAEHELVFNSFIPEAGHQSQAAKLWMDEIEERSEGRISFQRHFGGALADALEANDAMGQGRIDAGINSLAYQPEQYFLTEGLLKVPYQTNNIAALSAAIRDMNDSHPEASEEFSSKNLRMMTAIPTTSLLLHMSSKEVFSPEDLNGLSIRGAGATSPIDASLAAVGATPVGMPVTELYTSLQRGVVDGQMSAGFLDGPSWGIEEVTKQWVDVGFGPFAAPFLLMNEETYQGLPDDLKVVVDEASENLVQRYIDEIIPEASIEACDAVKKEDVKLTTMTDEDQKAWADKFADSYLDDWKGRIADRGVDADAYLAEFEAALEENSAGSEAQDAFLGCSN